MKKLLILPLIVITGLLAGCPKVESDARDAAAGLNGAITAAQTKHQAECTANPKLQACVTINAAIAGQNALVTAAEAYCGWSVAVPPVDPNAACVPVNSAKAGLVTAIANANLFITELKGLI